LDQDGNELNKSSRVSNLTVNPIGPLKQNLLQTVLSGKRYTSPVYLDPSTNEPLVLLAVPAEDIFRDPLGAFVAEVNLKFIWDLVGNIDVGKTGLVYVVDRTGRLIAFGDISRVLRGEDVSNLTEVNEFVSGKSRNESSDAEISRGIDNTLVVSNFYSLGVPDWAVVVEMPIREAYQTIINQIILSLLIIIISAILALFIAFYLSKRIIKPVIDLRDAVVEITNGKLDTTISISATNEIGQLSQAFNIMTEKLRESYRWLETKVEQKTSELTSNIKELEQTNKLMVDRELKMIEMKKEMERLKSNFK
jgi:methyl-accepting chemotaxis protein